MTTTTTTRAARGPITPAPGGKQKGKTMDDDLRQFGQGARVRQGAWDGEVIARHGKFCWVLFDDDAERKGYNAYPGTFWAKDLTLIDPAPVAAEGGE